MQWLHKCIIFWRIQLQLRRVGLQVFHYLTVLTLFFAVQELTKAELAQGNVLAWKTECKIFWLMQSSKAILKLRSISFEMSEWFVWSCLLMFIESSEPDLAIFFLLASIYGSIWSYFDARPFAFRCPIKERLSSCGNNFWFFLLGWCFVQIFILGSPSWLVMNTLLIIEFVLYFKQLICLVARHQDELAFVHAGQKEIASAGLRHEIFQSNIFVFSDDLALISSNVVSFAWGNHNKMCEQISFLYQYLSFRTLASLWIQSNLFELFYLLIMKKLTPFEHLCPVLYYIQVEYFLKTCQW